MARSGGRRKHRLTPLGVVGGPEYEVEYPNGDRSAYVAVVFTATVAGGTPSPDGDETTEVQWFSPSELRTQDLSAFTRAMFRELEVPG